MKASTLRAYPKHAFVLGKGEIAALTECLKETTGGDVDIVAESPDGKREFRGLAEFIGYEHASSRKLHELRLSSRDDSRSVRATVQFDARSWASTPIGVWAEAPDDQASKICQRLTEIVKRTKPWYSFLTHHVDAVNVVLLVLIAPNLIESFVGELSNARSNALTVFSTALWLNLGRFWLFSRGAFALWQGAARRRSAKSLLSPIGILTLVSFMVSLAALWASLV